MQFMLALIAEERSWEDITPDEVKKNLAEMGQQRRDAKPHYADDQLDVAIHSEQRLRLLCVAPIRPRAGDEAADAEPQHEYGDHQGRRIDRVPEHVAKHADPDDLVDQTTGA